MESEFEKLSKQPLFPAKRTKPLPGGYMGKILRVDLSDKKVTEENLPDPEILRKYPGGQSLAELILAHEIPGGITPLSPENPIVFMTGPLMGTGKTPSGTSYTVTTFSNITHFGSEGKGAVTSASAMGWWGPYLKFAGYDGIIIIGASKEPVYLWINNGKVEIRDASGIWGKDSQETIELVKQDVGQPDAKVAAIGPAGEKLVRFAVMINNLVRVPGWAGSGAVAGSKNLKAIAVRGTRGIAIAHPEEFEKACWEVREKVRKNPQSKTLARMGTMYLARQFYVGGYASLRNFSQASCSPDYFQKISGELPVPRTGDHGNQAAQTHPIAINIGKQEQPIVPEGQDGLAGGY